MAVHTFMIVYDQATRRSLPEGFTLLDNSNPKNPQLFEIEPILDYLERHPIEDTDFYGFFSPKLMRKTGLSGKQVVTLASRLSARHDICSLSPYPGHMATFINPVAQGEHYHAGFTMRFRALGDVLPEPLRSSAGDYIRRRIPDRYTLMSHCFWATGKFWKHWASTVRQILVRLEQDQDFASLLNAPCPHDGTQDRYQFKIFLLERVAGLLAWHSQSRVALPYRSQIWRHGCRMLPGVSITRGRAMLRALRRWLRRDVIR